MTTHLLAAAFGLLLLFGGGEILLRGAVSLARRLGFSELLIGLTVVGFGTSLPELLVSLQASLGGQPEIALGNVVGSNIANILLIAGVAGLIAPPSAWNRTIRLDATVMVFASLMLMAIAFHGALSGWVAALLLVALAAYLCFSFFMGKTEDTEDATPADSLSRSLLFISAGFAALFIGANYLIDGATGIARAFGISEAVIGLTLIAVGTSLPELATAIISALRRNTDMVLGNLIGSNIFNILAILGITGLIAPFGFAERFAIFDIPVMLGVAVAFAVLLASSTRIPRPVSAMMLAAYGVYLWVV